MQVNIDPRGTNESKSSTQESTPFGQPSGAEVPNRREHNELVCFALTTFGALR